METDHVESRNGLYDFSAQITAAVENAAGSVVAIDARRRVATSGIIWRSGGVIVSTNHTIQRDDDITVALGDGRTAKASLVGRDAGCDLAVLKIDDQAVAESLKPADVAETSAIKVGNFALAIGRTSADGGVTASFGIINRVGGAWRTWRGDEIERFISLDLAIYLGFSGGALINADGRILGVNTSAFGRGLALAIPSETVTRVADVLLAKGRIVRPYLGIRFSQTIPISKNLRERLNLDQSYGLMIVVVEANGAAEQAGVLIGDILLAIDDKPTFEPADVRAALWTKEAGNTVVAKLLRGGEPIEIEITLGESSAQESEASERGRKGWQRRGWR